MGQLKYLAAGGAIISTSLALTLAFNHLKVSPPPILPTVLILSAISADYVSTVKASKLGATEGNPLVGLVFKRIGVKLGGLVALIILTASVLFLWRDIPPYQQLAMACAYLIVPINNIIVIRRRLIREVR